MVGSLSSPGLVRSSLLGSSGLATVHRIPLRNISTFFLGIKVLFVL